jgi:hypothetical protein
VKAARAAEAQLMVGHLPRRRDHPLPQLLFVLFD